MEKPNILGCEVNTPDGRGSIRSLHNGRVIICLNKIEHNQVMKGISGQYGALHFSYEYKDVEIIKGRYEFKDSTN